MKKLNVFMIMPFQEEFLKLYEMIKEKLQNEFEFSNAGDLDNQQNILQDIVEGIANADVVIADVTGLNPNVFYELGLCHSLNKKVILITQDISELPFDIRAYRANEYKTDFWKINEIIEKIEGYLRGVQNGNVQFGNPIKDYYPVEQKEIKFIEQSDKKEDENEEEKGFLDFIADIDENAEGLTNELNKMQDELCKMTNGIEYGTNEMSRISQKPGSGNASFIRNTIKKIALGIQDFSDRMKIHNSNFELKWEKIENNFIDLIDNKYMEESANKDGLISSLKGLYGMKIGIISSNEKVDEMINMFASSKGIERKLTQAVNSLEEQMYNYLGIMNTMVSSIDRIICKAELLVGNIDFEKEAID